MLLLPQRVKIKHPVSKSQFNSRQDANCIQQKYARNLIGIQKKGKLGSDCTYKTKETAFTAMRKKNQIIDNINQTLIMSPKT